MTGLSRNEAGRTDEARQGLIGNEIVGESVYRLAGASGWDRWDTRGGNGRFVRAEGGDWRRFWSHVDLDPRTGCWLWTGRLTADGYPLLDIAGRPVRAHRWAWEQTHGSLAAGLTLDHLTDGACTSHRCVRPTASALGFHLEPVTNAENLRRRHARTRSAR